MPKAKKVINETFEQAMQRLEQLVKDMEADNIPLEEAIAKFTDGVQLSKYCSDKLDQAEQKITMLLQEASGEIREKPFGF